jgi:hypothetical protein
MKEVWFDVLDLTKVVRGLPYDRTGRTIARYLLWNASVTWMLNLYTNSN